MSKDNSFDVRVVVMIDKEISEWLDEQSKQTKLSKGTLIRSYLNDVMKETNKNDKQ